MTGPSYTLLGADGIPYASAEPGALGGHRRSRIFGRLDCPAALRAIARGGYTHHRVFFLDEQAAVRNGYRPCGVCLPDAHRRWKASAKDWAADRGSPGDVGASPSLR